MHETPHSLNERNPSRLFLFPSTTDTLGQVVLESQCSGVPVLVTDQGGPRSVVRDGVTGLVLPADQPRAWIDAMVALASDPARLRRMGHAAHEYARNLNIERSFDDFWTAHRR